MASTFEELYSDFTDQAKLYTSRLDVTELSFMRMVTRGAQLFQRDAKYIERSALITSNNNRFYAPIDMLYPLKMRDNNHPEREYLLQEYTQFERNVTLWPGGKLETPTDYGMRMVPQQKAATSGGMASRQKKQPYIYTIIGREIIVYPSDGAAEYQMFYIPDIHAISKNSPQWNSPESMGDPAILDSNGDELTFSWFPLDEIVTVNGVNTTRFMHHFSAFSFSPALMPFESAFVDYALSQYIKGQGSANYQAYYENFRLEVVMAKEKKPKYFREGAADYMFACFA